MPLLGTRFDELNPYRGDRSGGKGIGNPNDTIDRVRYRLRQPEGRYIPIGRGIYGGKPLPQQTDRRDVVPVTVGSRVAQPSPKKPAVTIIPKMVGQTNQPSPVASPPVVRRSPVPQKEPAIPTMDQESQLYVVPSKKVPIMGLDLGNLISTGLDLYKRYEDIRRPTGVAAPQVIAAPQPVVAQTYWPEGYGVQQMAQPTFIDTAGMGGGVPFVDLIREPPPEALADNMKGWCFKKVCGVMKWVKQGRRRRRKLLTDSDYNGLLKLQTLKVNSNMNIAIAKSIGR